ncbi:MAG: PEGA domain-containing protein [Deltaproteobacteria bacterium]|nr:PEGA domain-containing protein [Deltaproteobacteria bacterium]
MPDALVPLFLLAACGGAAGRTGLESAVVVLDDDGPRAALESALERRGVEVTVLPAPPAREGAEPVARPRRLLEQAREAQQAFREAEALEKLATVEGVLAQDGVRTADRSLFAEAGFLRAWIHLSGGRPREAERAAADALVFASAADPAPARFPPEVVELAARLRATTGTATLRVEAPTVPASVSIDGRSVGLTPVEAGGLAAGGHFVTVEASGYRVISDRVELGPGARVIRRYTPEPSSAPELALAIATAAPAARTAVARRLAAALGQDSVLVAAASRAGGELRLSGELVARDGRTVRAQARGANAQVAAERLVSRFLETPVSRSFFAEPLVWIATGVLLAGAAGVTLFLLLPADDPSVQGGDGTGSVTCCDVR